MLTSWQTTERVLLLRTLLVMRNRQLFGFDDLQQFTLLTFICNPSVYTRQQRSANVEF
jgi:hypothetical protein